ncbi:unnamed protein product [Linum tenue]|uniref:Uncharacterized protein n=1 Tax=Linum tenue TaxID=586396 RepID=A0AAV0NLG9_9ROSI|nr:unnamed protein product [Linum tenue]CAI0459395.1 unnamed protein product [Linum tenue]
MCISHCLTDGFTATEVVNSWAEIARGLPISVLPSLDKSSLLPRNPPKVEFPHPEFTNIENKSSSSNSNDFSKENMVCRVFHFNCESIKKLKSKAMEDAVISKCSTFECLTAFIWIARSKALNMVADQETKLMVPVNVREKMDPPLPKGHLGNGIAVACTISKAKDLNNESFSTTVGLVQDAIKMVTDASVRSSIDYHDLHRSVHSFGHTILATTWSRIPFGTTDFGWGDAIFMAPVALPIDEMVIFFPGNGKEHYGDMIVYIALPESTMKTFQNLVMM